MQPAGLAPHQRHCQERARRQQRQVCPTDGPQNLPPILLPGKEDHEHQDHQGENDVGD